MMLKNAFTVYVLLEMCSFSRAFTRGTALRGIVENVEIKENITPPNIIVFMVDDLGFNQVGFHAHKAGNMEVHTPRIDAYADEGIIMNRGYMAPWCAPSR